VLTVAMLACINVPCCGNRVKEIAFGKFNTNSRRNKDLCHIVDAMLCARGGLAQMEYGKEPPEPFLTTK